MRGRVGLLAELLRSEGPAGVAARLADRWAEGRRKASFQRVPIEALPPVQVLQIASAPPAPWLGGVPAQLGVRLAEQARRVDTALLYPWRGGMRLEVTAGGRRLAAEVPLERDEARAEDDPGWGKAVTAAQAAVGARLLHVEGASGLPHATLLELARERPLLLVIHDFALVCPRPNLFDERLASSCGPCGDGATCQRTLATSGRVEAPRAAGWRERGAEVLRHCRSVVYPSEFLRRAHERLFGNAGARTRVVAPGIARPAFPLTSVPTGVRPRPPHRPRLAFVGGGAPHKGALLFASVVKEWARRGLPAVDWEVLGGGGTEQLAELRRLPGVRVRGYYRHGLLPALLRARQIDLCLLLPQVPESFSLTLSEALAARVPVLALGAGALADRLAGSDLLLPADAPAELVVQALAGWSRGELAPSRPASVPLAGEAAAAIATLHAELIAAG